MAAAAIGIIGGSGFYDLPGLELIERCRVATPFGPPSDELVTGRLAGRRVVFLARHGAAHSLLPSEVNARANIYALKAAGATSVISISAVGSLREHIAPGDAVIPRQLIDRTEGRARTFFGGGIVVHVSLADPICGALADRVAVEAGGRGRTHDRGTYLCIEGPQFSTRAESELWRSCHADVVGMTAFPEARLAREAELCYAILALATDYDCWRPDDEVRVTDVLGVLRANAARARHIVSAVVAGLEPGRGCTCHRVLDTALLTREPAIPAAARERLGAILARRLARSAGGMS